MRVSERHQLTSERTQPHKTVQLTGTSPAHSLPRIATGTFSRSASQKVSHGGNGDQNRHKHQQRAGSSGDGNNATDRSHQRPWRHVRPGSRSILRGQSQKHSSGHQSRSNKPGDPHLIGVRNLPENNSCHQTHGSDDADQRSVHFNFGWVGSFWWRRSRHASIMPGSLGTVLLFAANLSRNRPSQP